MKDIDKAPEKVFLQVGDIPLGTPFNKLVSEEMTWSTDQQFQSDVLYIRADKVDDLRGKIDTLLGMLDTYDYVMPASLQDDNFKTSLEDIIDGLDSQSPVEFFEENFCSIEELNEACREHDVQEVKV